MLDESAQQPELERRQPKVNAVRSSGPLRELDRDGIVGIDGRQLLLSGSLAAEKRLHTG